MKQQPNRTSTTHPLILLAETLQDRVTVYRKHARRFFYAVMLSGHRCPECQSAMEMMDEAKAVCVRCSHQCDPTIAFQPCLECAGPLRLRHGSYECDQCCTSALSSFRFDQRVFDAAYFRERMAESRQRRREQCERLQAQAVESRSNDLLPSPADLGTIPGLLSALASLTNSNAELPQLTPQQQIDLRRYEQHVLAQLPQAPFRLVDIDPLGSDARLDRIWCFVAAIFLAHDRQLALEQDGGTIWVNLYEADTEGQSIS